MKKIAHITIISFLYSFPAIAQTATAYKDSSNTVFLYGVQPNSSVSVDAYGQQERAVTANACGLLLIRSTESFSIDNQTINPSSNLEVKHLPKTCNELTEYPTTFRTTSGAIAISQKIPGSAYIIKLLNRKTKRQFIANECGFVRINEVKASTLNLPTITGGRADFTVSNLVQAKPLLCIKGVLYSPYGFNLKTAVATALTQNSSGGNTGTTNTGTSSTGSGSTSSGSTLTVNSQTAQPTAAKNSSLNKLVVNSVPPGTYLVSNVSNPSQNKSYTVPGGKSCFIVERSQLGNPANFLVSRQGVAFPVSWGSVPEISAAAIPSC